MSDQTPDDDTEPFRFVVEFETSQSLTSLQLEEGKVPKIEIEHDDEGRGQPVWVVKIDDDVQAWVPESRMVAVFRLYGEDDDDGDDGEVPQPDPDGPNTDGLSVWVADDGTIHAGSTGNGSSIIGRRDELAERRAA